MSRRNSLKVMRKEWWGGRSTHHDVVLTIPVKKEHELLKIFRQLFSNHVPPPVSSVLFSSGCHYTAVESTKVRECQKENKKARHEESEN